jgi:hypothetical protein
MDARREDTAEDYRARTQGGGASTEGGLRTLTIYLRHRRAPEFGEHTGDRLMNMLGLTWDDITHWRVHRVGIAIMTGRVLSCRV